MHCLHDKFTQVERSGRGFDIMTSNRFLEINAKTEQDRIKTPFLKS